MIAQTVTCRCDHCSAVTVVAAIVQWLASGSVTMRVQYQGTWYSTSDGRQFCSPKCEDGYMWRRYQYVRLKGGGWGRWQAAEDWSEPMAEKAGKD